MNENKVCNKEVCVQMYQQVNEEQTQLLLDDLHIMSQIIRACSQRGSFLAKEMICVGVLYEKIQKIIREMSNAQPNDTQPHDIQPKLPNGSRLSVIPEEV